MGKWSTHILFTVSFADQFLSVATTLPQNYNIYGLGEHKTSLRFQYKHLLVGMYATYTLIVN